MIQHFQYLEKPLVIHSFLPILQTSQIHTFLRLIIGIHHVLDHMMNCSIYLHYLKSTWFSDAFISFFGYPCYLFTQCGKYYVTFRFIKTIITLLIRLYKTISVKHNLEQNFTLRSSISHGLFNIISLFSNFFISCYR